MPDLFENLAPLDPVIQVMAEGAVLLRGEALSIDKALLAALDAIAERSPFRHMVTPDRTGYRYDSSDPVHGHAWPPMPDCFAELATRAAARAGYPDFRPDACLINRYEPGARLTLHQDKNERDFALPIVSVSLGLPATFQFGGLKRNDPVKRYALRHGDVAVWGGPSRLRFHGVSDLKDGEHQLVGRQRINLTFRGAL